MLSWTGRGTPKITLTHLNPKQLHEYECYPQNCLSGKARNATGNCYQHHLTERTACHGITSHWTNRLPRDNISLNEPHATGNCTDKHLIERTSLVYIKIEIQKWHQLNFWDSWPPPPSEYQIHATSLPLVRIWLTLTPPLYWRHLCMVPSASGSPSSSL